MYDVAAMGELLIDFTAAGLSAQGNELYECNPGGGPANLLVALARLGGSGCFIGSVGDDRFGHMLGNVLARDGVSTDGLLYTGKASTTLAFVHLDAGGERSFSFARKPGADMLLAFSDISTHLIDEAKLLHISGVSLTAESARSACLEAAAYAKGKGIPVSFDPNWRPPLWDSEESARKWIREGVKLATVLKVSGEEMELITGTSNPQEGGRMLLDYGPELVFVTLGAGGCHFFTKQAEGFVPAFRVDAVDTTGAGDAFTAAVLYQLTRREQPAAALASAELTKITLFACAVGALCATKRGGVPGMPALRQVEEFLSAR